ncbi:DNA replication licensing factor MCM6, putative [Cryptosporidium muris RN66]|uniref:DNA replication licensing factor MCM6 n=1 Tax=Cryptosporidium muris (strain RN66) TaxID=441375 RepID=B6ABN5_CRYMR|nr:DNA replication licensing factor MCM6, putative [Cryptosporidium muris RN66]EEA05787.1 DNA replication licensing factor MCM6, putative [Cryptosporidium muris RN66]|eukprot:XP_002140136.1 DNA replication licensing factor MCM6 [Cryptosporidium muris RN66]
MSGILFDQLSLSVLDRSFLSFLRNFRDRENFPKYVNQAEQLVTSRLSHTLYIDINDLLNYCNNQEVIDEDTIDNPSLLSGPSLLSLITEYYGELKDAINGLITSFCHSLIINNEGNNRAGTSAITYSASFYGLRWIESLRTLRCEKLGKLISVRGTITRTSDVRPELLKGCFECEICGNIVDNVIQQFVYTLPVVCPTKGCGNRTAWQLKLEHSDFGDWQKLRIQEHATEIPPGSMPRSMDAILRGDCVDRCKPGDKVILTGQLIVAPDIPSLMKPGDVPSSVVKDRARNRNNDYSGISGLKSLGTRDLGYRLCFLACHIETVNAVASLDDGRILESLVNSNNISSHGNILSDITNNSENSDPLKLLNISEESYKKFVEIAQHQNGLNLLAKYIAPQVFGYPDLKKGILLQLVGGVEKRTKDNIKLRGDINVCIVGDPSTAKSQVLQFVQKFATRTVYTSGKSSTAAGLTASVHRDLDQGDFVIEAGALMLADKGICCIDEFDKMDDKDVVAIHEAMEQQTISITKAGVLATLNARASVLAACSPIGGRYNPSKTLSQNVKISAPILSRFDLFFVMIDDPEEVYDEVLASFIVKLHALAVNNQTDIKGKQIDEADNNMNLLQLNRAEVAQYIAYAKTFKPTITLAAKLILVRTYQALRMSDTTTGTRAMRITVRQLESLIRLSEAIAKLRFSYVVTSEHVEEACSVFKNSLSKVRYGDIDLCEMDIDDEEHVENEHINEESNQDISKLSKQSNNTIGYTEYFKIARRMVDHVLDIEKDSGEASIEVTDLISWYISEYDHPQSEDELSELERRYHRAILRMIHRDMIFYIAHREEIIQEDLGKDSEILTNDNNEPIIRTFIRVHPNYIQNTDLNSDNKIAKHADFAYRTFGETERVEVNNINDVDILELNQNLEPEDFLQDNIENIDSGNIEVDPSLFDDFDEKSSQNDITSQNEV